MAHNICFDTYWYSLQRLSWGGCMDGWLENEFLKKTPSPKFGLVSQLGTSDFGVCQFQVIPVSMRILKFWLQCIVHGCKFSDIMAHGAAPRSANWYQVNKTVHVIFEFNRLPWNWWIFSWIIHAVDFYFLSLCPKGMLQKLLLPE